MSHDLFGVRIDDLSFFEFQNKTREWLNGEVGRMVFTPNAEFLLDARNNDAFRTLLNQSDLSIPDSVSLCFAIAALSGERLSFRLPGVDALICLAKLCEDSGRRLVLFGGEGGVQDRATHALKKQFPILGVTGYDPGKIYFNGNRVELEESVVSKLRSLEPDVVAVALGQGRQEFAIAQLKALVPHVKIWIGIGGALDMLAGDKPRASMAIRRIGFEWLWRFCIEPKRWRRTINASIIFPLIVIRDTLKTHCFLRACARVVKEVLSL